MRTCEHCGADLTGRRPQARYCGSTCRSKACRKRKGTRDVKKPLKSVARGSKRRVRREHGTDLYVLPSEIEFLAAYVASAVEAMPRLEELLGPPLDGAADLVRLDRKLTRAAERIRRRQDGVASG